MRTPFFRPRRFAALALAMFAVPSVLSPHPRLQSSAPALVVVEFRALGPDRQPVLDLTAREVTLRVGGRARETKSLELVRHDRNTPPAVVPEPFATNTAAARSGRDVLIVVDEESIMPGREAPVRDAILQLAGALGPADRVRLLSTRQGGINIDLPDRDAGARAALGRFSGYSSADETADRLICRSRVAVQVLRTVLASYAGQPPPTVVLISGGFGAPPAGGAALRSGSCPALQTSEFGEVGTAAGAAGARVYVVNAVDATASRLSREVLATGLEALAGAMGADIINMVGGRELAMTRIATETSAYYLAAFQPDPGERTGARQRAEVQVAREGVKVRAAANVVLPKAEGAAAGGKSPLPNDMLRAATAYRDLRLRAAAFASRGDDGGKIRLVVLFEPADPGVKLAGAAVGLYDAKGKLTRWTAEAADLARSPAMGGIIVPAGTYRMRVAAVDASGRAGTVDTEVQADLQGAGPVKLSAMMVGVAGPDGGFTPRLQFDADKGAFGYFEIYGIPKGATLAVRLEIAASPEGPALVSDDAPLTPGPADDMRIAYSGYAIEGMPPGDVVMRALVSVDGKPAGRLVRTLRKVNAPRPEGSDVPPPIGGRRQWRWRSATIPQATLSRLGGP